MNRAHVIFEILFQSERFTAYVTDKFFGHAAFVSQMSTQMAFILVFSAAPIRALPETRKFVDVARHFRVLAHRIWKITSY